MDPRENQKELLKLKNIGARCALQLHEAHITPQSLRILGAKEAFLRIWTRNPKSSTLCACFLYALQGAIDDVHWCDIPQAQKDDFKAFTGKIRASFRDPKTDFRKQP